MLTDVRGTEIKVGSTIIYPGRHSSSCWLTIGIVKAIDGGRLKVRGTQLLWGRLQENKRDSVITALNKIVVISLPSTISHGVEILHGKD